MSRSLVRGRCGPRIPEGSGCSIRFLSTFGKLGKVCWDRLTGKGVELWKEVKGVVLGLMNVGAGDEKVSAVGVVWAMGDARLGAYVLGSWGPIRAGVGVGIQASSGS